MVLLIELLITVILIMIFSTLIVDQRKNRTRGMRVVRLKGYWDGNERRSVERLNITLGVRYSINKKIADVKSRDISTKGIRLLLDEKIEKGTPLRMAIKLPTENHLINTDGEVMWAEESLEDEKIAAKRLFNTGIKFDKLRADDEKRLFNFISSFQPSNSKNG